MSETTRTRAEIQAEIEQLEKELEAIPPRKWMDGDKAYLRVALLDVEEFPNYPDVETDSGQRFEVRSANDLIPAADLIPRAEHEAAVAEAQKVTVERAVARLAASLVDAHTAQHLFETPSEKYRVTVERVAAADAIANHPVHPGRPHDYDQGYPPDDQPADAEPVDQASANRLVEWYAANNREHKMTWSHEVNGRTYFVCVAPHDGTGYAPDPQAAAPKGVVEELRGLIRALGDEADSDLTDSWTRCAIKRLDGITELPPPSEWAREHSANGYIQSRRRDLAAALLESEGDHD